MEWIGLDRTQNRTKFDGDVIVSYENHGDETRVQFKFRKNSSYKITSGEHIVIAKDEDRIYFKESDTKGFKLGNYANNVRVIKVKFKKLPLKEDCLGEYNLELDSKLGLHYICLNRKLEKQLFWETK